MVRANRSAQPQEPSPAPGPTGRRSRPQVASGDSAQAAARRSGVRGAEVADGSSAGGEVSAPATASALADSLAPAGTGDGETDSLAADLNFREAQTALELSLAELQSPDLDLEEMGALYRRASSYADRCQALLDEVEQEVLQWDPEQPGEPPRPHGQ